MDWAIRTESVSKAFSKERFDKTMFRLLAGTLLQNGTHRQLHFALKNINLEVRPGEKIGVIGNNGAGKSTLLRLLAGLYAPTEGRVYVNGDVKILAGLGIGMIDDLSVEDNVYLYGAIYGMEREAIRDKFAEIVRWAEVDNFVGAELRMLSSGMRARLAFSIIRHVEADILLFDEALTAGDKNFKEKCNEVLDGYKGSKRTFMIATHDVEFAKKFCSKTLWLAKGEQVTFGETEKVVEEYLAGGKS